MGASTWMVYLSCFFIVLKQVEMSAKLSNNILLLYLFVMADSNQIDHVTYINSTICWK